MASARRCSGKTSAVDQRARLVGRADRPERRAAAFETIVLDVDGAMPTAYTVFVDARNGDDPDALQPGRPRRRRSDSPRGRAEPRRGADLRPVLGHDTVGTNCGPDHAIVAPAGTWTIDIVATATVPANDIILYLLDSTLTEIDQPDTATSPEAIHHEFVAPTSGTFYARVCEFNAGDAPFTYDGAFATNDVAGTGSVLAYPPKWKYFRANPSLANDPSPDDPYDLTSTPTRASSAAGC